MICFRSIGSLNQPKKKMVCVASAFVGCPPLSILDDPLDGLERPDRDRMCNAINSLKCRGERFVIFTVCKRICTDRRTDTQTDMILVTKHT